MTVAAPAPYTQRVASWGRLSNENHRVLPLHDRAAPGLAAGAPAVAYGNGRSYGDACLNPGGALWALRGLDRFIAFDTDSGVIECEAGVLLQDIIRVALPHGWFLPVTPGTQFATLGGAIANDVHGKNHHRAGTLGEHIESMWLARTDGSRRLCGPQHDAPWFAATVGGLGLTGVIVSARLRLKRVPGPWLATVTTPFETLAQFFALSQQAEQAPPLGAEYGVAWIDCVGGSQGQQRGAFFSADHVAHDAVPAPARPARSVPLTPPVSLINGGSLRLFNAAYYRAQRLNSGPRIQHYQPFFYPLDQLLHWNRLYGPRGFFQYQCVVPQAVQVDATAALLAAIRASGTGSFLAVLKTFAPRPSVGLLSFPLAGTTLALDFPHQGDTTRQLFSRLDAIVSEAGGRLYAAKDACMDASLFRLGYPRLAEFLPFRDPGISSAMSRRLLGS